jgi:hypothetical protein
MGKNYAPRNITPSRHTQLGLGLSVAFFIGLTIIGTSPAHADGIANPAPPSTDNSQYAILPGTIMADPSIDTIVPELSPAPEPSVVASPNDGTTVTPSPVVSPTPTNKAAVGDPTPVAKVPLVENNTPSNQLPSVTLPSSNYLRKNDTVPEILSNGYVDPNGLPADPSLPDTSSPGVGIDQAIPVIIPPEFGPTPVPTPVPTPPPVAKPTVKAQSIPGHVFTKEVRRLVIPVVESIMSGKLAFYKRMAIAAGLSNPNEYALTLAALQYRENNNNIRPRIDPQNGHEIRDANGNWCVDLVTGNWIAGCIYTNVDTKGEFTSLAQLWEATFKHITNNGYGVNIPTGRHLTLEEFTKIATWWRYGQKLEWKPGDTIPQNFDWHESSYALNGYDDGDYKFGVMPHVVTPDGTQLILSSQGGDDRLGAYVVYIALTQGVKDTPQPTPTTKSKVNHIDNGSSYLPYADKILPLYGFTVNMPSSHNMVYYSQNKDPRWNFEQGIFGNGHTVAECGCGPTSVAMVVATLTGDGITPDKMVSIQRRFGGINGSCGTAGPYSFPAIAEYFGLKAKLIGYDWNKVDETIRNGGLVIASLNPSKFGGSHYVVIRGITKDGEYLVANPLRGQSDTKDFTATTIGESHRRDEFPINLGMVAFLPPSS